MTTSPVKTGSAPNAVQTMESALINGDLSKFTPEQRTKYYLKVCESIGLNPLTKPFDYITLQGKLTLYARKDCTDQLRAKRGVSVRIVGREVANDLCTVTAQATLGDRTDEALGVVPLAGLKGSDLANALMKAETKAKRRVTLSICGLGVMDESEVEDAKATSAETKAEALKSKLAQPYDENFDKREPGEE